MNKLCYIDNPEGDPECVIDSGATDDCDEAYELNAQGLCKDDCPYWRRPKAVASECKSATEDLAVRVLLRSEAKAAREELTLSDFETTMEAALARAPVFVGSFGHGYFIKRPS